ncbi:MAG: PfkB family carbohydrate kinase [Ilumatobacter fluminis]
MIVVVGEALIDLVIDPDGSVEAAAGGAPFNTARGVGRLGGDVAFAGVLGTDRFGTMLARRLADDGVDTSTAPRVDLPTTLAAAELDEHGAASYRFYFAGTTAPALDAPPTTTGDVLFAGGLGLVLEPMADTVATTVAGFDAQQ